MKHLFIVGGGKTIPAGCPRAILRFAVPPYSCYIGLGNGCYLFEFFTPLDVLACTRKAAHEICVFHHVCEPI